MSEIIHTPKIDQTLVFQRMNYSEHYSKIMTITEDSLYSKIMTTITEDSLSFKDLDDLIYTVMALCT